jgi:hypothetical protein
MIRQGTLTTADFDRKGETMRNYIILFDGVTDGHCSVWTDLDRGELLSIKGVIAVGGKRPCRRFISFDPRYCQGSIIDEIERMAHEKENEPLPVESELPPPQQIVADNVRERGYYQDGSGRYWLDFELACRQICKMLEEVAEAAKYVWLPWPLRLAVRIAGALARWYFDKEAPWHRACLGEYDILSFKGELSDMQVVLFVAGDAYGHDVVQGAVDKSAADRERGRRPTGPTDGPWQGGNSDE